MIYLDVSQATQSSHTHTHTLYNFDFNSFLPLLFGKMTLISTKIQLYENWHLLRPKLRVILDPVLCLTSYSQLVAQTTLVHVIVSRLDHCTSLLTALSATLPLTPTALLCSSNPFSTPLSEHS